MADRFSLGYRQQGDYFGQPAADCFTLVEGGEVTPILLDEKDDIGVAIAAKNLQDDFRKVTGMQAELLHSVKGKRFDCGWFFGEQICQGTRKDEKDRYNFIGR